MALWSLLSLSDKMEQIAEWKTSALDRWILVIVIGLGTAAISRRSVN